MKADAFRLNRFDVTGIVPAGYAIFAMALGICASTLLRRTLPALAVTLAGFVALRASIADWLRPHYMTPVTVYYKLTAPFAVTPNGSYLPISQGITGPQGKPSPAVLSGYVFNGGPIPAACRKFLQNPAPCMAAHGYRAYLTYQPASRFWAFQGIEAGIFVVLGAALLGVTFWVLKRRDA
jgi:hypothetical protein